MEVVTTQIYLLTKSGQVFFRNKFSLICPLRVRREHNVEQTLDFSGDRPSSTGAVPQIWIKIEVKIKILILERTAAIIIK